MNECDLIIGDAESPPLLLDLLVLQLVNVLTAALVLAVAGAREFGTQLSLELGGNATTQLRKTKLVHTVSEPATETEVSWRVEATKETIERWGRGGKQEVTKRWKTPTCNSLRTGRGSADSVTGTGQSDKHPPARRRRISNYRVRHTQQSESNK